MKTLYLLKMGMDIVPDENTQAENHRIKFCTRTEDKEYIIEFGTCAPFKLKENKAKTEHKVVYGLDNTAFYIDGQYRAISSEDYEPWYRFDIETLDLDLEKVEGFENHTKYTYNNILKIVNKLLGSDFDTIKLLECRYIVCFDFNTFDSAKFELNEIMYNRAMEFEKLAKQKIDSIKVDCRYNNSSYYYEGKDFMVTVHYNCYNDINYFNLEDYDKAVEQLNNYKMPVDKIKMAIKERGLNPNHLY